MIKLFDYQKKAVEKLVRITSEIIKLQTPKTIVFKAPTGSGKTVMVAEYLKELVEDHSNRNTYTFIWTAPRQLHEQSKTKLEAYYANSKALRCVYFEDLIDRQIHQNEILFLNWESINKADNIYIRENEIDLNLSTILQNTRDAGHLVILIIDESHFASQTEISRGLIQMFGPKVTIEVSATPNLQGDEQVTVYPEEVISEGAIKKQISINPGFINQVIRQTDDKILFETTASESTDEFILRVALETREQLAQALQRLGSSVNPLLLIQLPDKREGEYDFKDEVLQILRDQHNITLENGKLAVYLSKDKTNLENIIRNDNEVEVMIFKQAIALGWDCPRASILALFRVLKSYTFSTQTLGRILRMPELKHYPVEELNIGYVFTNLEDLSILGDTAGSYLTIQFSQRIEDYQDVNLRSVHLKRFREETRLSPQFTQDFLTATNDLNLKEKLQLNVSIYQKRMISDAVINDIDEHPLSIVETADVYDRILNPVEIQTLFNEFVVENLSPFFPEARSIGRVKDAIYRFFQLAYPNEFEYGDSRIQNIVLNANNRQHVVNVINRAKDIYQQGIEKGRKEIITTVWNVPTSKTFSQRYTARQMNKSVMQPFFERTDASQPEKQFAEFINNMMQNVEWFYRNGESDATAFAIPYISDQGLEVPFYVDWIIKFKDGRIGLFDTKGGITAETAKTRAEGLAVYISEEKSKGKNLFGGIVINSGGSWLYNDRKVYEFNQNNLQGWKYLS